MSPSPLDSTFLSCAWRSLVTLSWEAEPRLLAGLVPSGLELDDFEGRALVSLVGFQFLDTRAMGVPLPFHSRFEEVNLRFYVRRRAPEGWRRGVVFVKEIVPRRLVTLGARWLFNEPYCTRPMRHQVETRDGAPIAGGTLAYEWSEHGRWHQMSARVGPRLGVAAPGSPQEFVVERYWGYTRQRNGRTVEYRVRHVPWTLWQGADPRIDVDGPSVYGPQLGSLLVGAPCSAIVADGSPVTVSRGQRL